MRAGGNCNDSRVKFVSIPVVDQDRALAFYTEKLGFRVATDQPFDDKQRWIELAIPGAETGVVLFRMDEGPQPGGFMNMSLWTDDVRVTARTLKERVWNSLPSRRKRSGAPRRSSRTPKGTALC
jgi:catechol 2,3-dioxygenase-like lactoylglutathione lyase family enzyme